MGFLNSPRKRVARLCGRAARFFVVDRSGRLELADTSAAGFSAGLERVRSAVGAGRVRSGSFPGTAIVGCGVVLVIVVVVPRPVSRGGRELIDEVM